MIQIIGDALHVVTDVMEQKWGTALNFIPPWLENLNLGISKLDDLAVIIHGNFVKYYYYVRLLETLFLSRFCNWM